MDIVGQIISGNHGKLLVRQKSDKSLELGELLVCSDNGETDILQVYDLRYGSQISGDTLEAVSGMQLEGVRDSDFYDSNMRNYVLANVKQLLRIENGKPKIPKKLPNFFSKIRRIQPNDLSFLEKPENPLFVGNVRSGSIETRIPVYLDGKKVLSHHVLVPATTGRGKSNLIKVILWDIMKYNYAGVLVLDPHDEYYEQNGEGLKFHPRKEKVVSYSISKNSKPGQETLKINIKHVKPWHLKGIINFTDAQNQAMYLYYKDSSDEWIKNIITGKELNKGIHETTLPALARKLSYLFSIDEKDEKLFFGDSIFSDQGGENTISNIIDSIEDSKVVIIDTSSLSGKIELLVGSIISNQLLERYKHYKMDGTLISKPVASVIIEEAPRVLGHTISDNVYSTIAREGRKFKVGLVGITQLSSEIPRNLLANMNTKIILGNEMQSERAQIIASAAQDLSDDDRTIASLEQGEAIVSTIFSSFPVPIKIPYFSEFRKRDDVKTMVV